MSPPLSQLLPIICLLALNRRQEWRLYTVATGAASSSTLIRRLSLVRRTTASMAAPSTLCFLPSHPSSPRTGRRRRRCEIVSERMMPAPTAGSPFVGAIRLSSGNDDKNRPTKYVDDDTDMNLLSLAPQGELHSQLDDGDDSYADDHDGPATSSTIASSEAEILLACRAYLVRKHRYEWTEKKRRTEAALSVRHLEGYFWPDPSELVYLREKPDPSRWKDGTINSDIERKKKEKEKSIELKDAMLENKARWIEQYGGDNDGGDAVEYLSSIPNDKITTTSYNPFSIYQAFPPAEHVKRSEAKLKLWKDDEWRKRWYEIRWKDRAQTPEEKRDYNHGKLLNEIPIGVLESEELASLTEEEVAEALRTYASSNRRKSEAYEKKEQEKEDARAEFRSWRKKIKDAGEAERKRTMAVLRNETSTASKLTFEPSAEEMKRLREARAERSRKAFRTRLANLKASSDVDAAVKLPVPFKAGRKSTNGGEDGQQAVSPMQAILQIDQALNRGETPSPIDVQTMLVPGRLGRRREVLRRILNECFNLRGKCVPSMPTPISSGDKRRKKRPSGGEVGPTSSNGIVVAAEEEDEGPSSSPQELLFATKCTIEELGAFVLLMLRHKVRNMT